MDAIVYILHLFYILLVTSISRYVTTICTIPGSGSFKNTDNIKNYICVAKLLNILLDKYSDVFDNVSLKLVIKGMAHIKSHTPKQVLPITKTVLLQMNNMLDMSNLDHIVNWSLFLIEFFPISRKTNSQLIPIRGTHLDFCLDRTNVIF